MRRGKTASDSVVASSVDVTDEFIVRVGITEAFSSVETCPVSFCVRQEDNHRLLFINVQQTNSSCLVSGLWE